MKYLKIYNKLIEQAQHRNLSGYKERHHIVPRCMGGSDDDANIVSLTAREHYVAHQLLIKLHPKNYKLVYAAMMMCVCGNGQFGRSKTRYYAWIKERHSIVVSERQKGTGNSNYGMCWVKSIEKQDSRKIPKEDLDIWIQQGYVKGRRMNWDVPIKKKKTECRMCGENVCQQIDVCGHPQLIRSLIELFDFDKIHFGNTAIYNEFDRIRTLLYNMHHNQDISKLQIAKNVNASHQRINNIFKSLKIPSRTKREMNKAFHARKNVGVAE